MSLLAIGSSESSDPKIRKTTKSLEEKLIKSSEKSETPAKKSSILEALLKRADISEEDLEQLREELNKKKK